MGHDVHEHAAQRYNGHQVDRGQLAVDRKGHDHGDDHAGRRADRHAQDHLVGVLDVGHVGGHAGDKTGRGVFVDVGKAEGLDVAEHRLAQVAGQAGGRLGAEHRAAHAEGQAHERGDDHPAACRIDVLHVARRNAVVNDGRHQARHDHFHDDLTQHAQRCQDRNELEPVDLFVECLYHMICHLSFSAIHGKHAVRSFVPARPAPRRRCAHCFVICPKQSAAFRAPLRPRPAEGAFQTLRCSAPSGRSRPPPCRWAPGF